MDLGSPPPTRNSASPRAKAPRARRVTLEAQSSSRIKNLLGRFSATLGTLELPSPGWDVASGTDSPTASSHALSTPPLAWAQGNNVSPEQHHWNINSMAREGSPSDHRCHASATGRRSTKSTSTAQAAHMLGLDDTWSEFLEQSDSEDGSPSHQIPRIAGASGTQTLLESMRVERCGEKQGGGPAEGLGALFQYQLDPAEGSGAWVELTGPLSPEKQGELEHDLVGEEACSFSQLESSPSPAPTIPAKGSAEGADPLTFEPLGEGPCYEVVVRAVSGQHLRRSSWTQFLEDSDSDAEPAGPGETAPDAQGTCTAGSHVQEGGGSLGMPLSLIGKSKSEKAQRCGRVLKRGSSSKRWEDVVNDLRRSSPSSGHQAVRGALRISEEEDTRSPTSLIATRVGAPAQEAQASRRLLELLGRDETAGDYGLAAISASHGGTHTRSMPVRECQLPLRRVAADANAKVDCTPGRSISRRRSLPGGARSGGPMQRDSSPTKIEEGVQRASLLGSSAHGARPDQSFDHSVMQSLSWIPHWLSSGLHLRRRPLGVQPCCISHSSPLLNMTDSGPLGRSSGAHSPAPCDGGGSAPPGGAVLAGKRSRPTHRLAKVVASSIPTQGMSGTQVVELNDNAWGKPSGHAGAFGPTDGAGTARQGGQRSGGRGTGGAAKTAQQRTGSLHPPAAENGTKRMLHRRSTSVDSASFSGPQAEPGEIPSGRQAQCTGHKGPRAVEGKWGSLCRSSTLGRERATIWIHWYWRDGSTGAGRGEQELNRRQALVGTLEHSASVMQGRLSLLGGGSAVDRPRPEELRCRESASCKNTESRLGKTGLATHSRSASRGRPSRRSVEGVDVGQGYSGTPWIQSPAPRTARALHTQSLGPPQHAGGERRPAGVGRRVKEKKAQRGLTSSGEEGQVVPTRSGGSASGRQWQGVLSPMAPIPESSEASPLRKPVQAQAQNFQVAGRSAKGAEAALHEDVMFHPRHTQEGCSGSGRKEAHGARGAHGDAPLAGCYQRSEKPLQKPQDEHVPIQGRDAQGAAPPGHLCLPEAAGASTHVANNRSVRRRGPLSRGSSLQERSAHTPHVQRAHSLTGRGGSSQHEGAQVPGPWHKQAVDFKQREDTGHELPVPSDTVPHANVHQPRASSAKQRSGSRPSQRFRGASGTSSRSLNKSPSAQERMPSGDGLPGLVNSGIQRVPAVGNATGAFQLQRSLSVERALHRKCGEPHAERGLHNGDGSSAATFGLLLDLTGHHDAKVSSIAATAEVQGVLPAPAKGVQDSGDQQPALSTAASATVSSGSLKMRKPSSAAISLILPSTGSLRKGSNMQSQEGKAEDGVVSGASAGAGGGLREKARYLLSHLKGGSARNPLSPLLNPYATADVGEESSPSAPGGNTIPRPWAWAERPASAAPLKQLTLMSPGAAGVLHSPNSVLHGDALPSPASLTHASPRSPLAAPTVVQLLPSSIASPSSTMLSGGDGGLQSPWAVKRRILMSALGATDTVVSTPAEPPLSFTQLPPPKRALGYAMGNQREAECEDGGADFSDIALGKQLNELAAEYRRRRMAAVRITELAVELNGRGSAATWKGLAHSGKN